VAEPICLGCRGQLDEPELIVAVRPSSLAPSPIETLVRRDRLVALLGLAAVAGLAWLYLLRMAAGMHSAAAEADMHAAMGMPDMAAWGSAELLSLFVMWAVMMAAMMLPSAAPVMLLVMTTYRRRGVGARGLTAAFGGGYLAVWTAFSAAAASLQFVLHGAAVLSPAAAARSAVVAGALFLVAGVYQWLPIKSACLTHCRSPLGFLTTEWRDGVGGAVLMGVRHGSFCVGCCWALMVLLFAGGVMNLFWVAAIAAFVLLEKLLRQGTWLSRVAGGLLIVWGAYLVAAGL
jgi:predicted metal-binding membrane protein